MGNTSPTKRFFRFGAFYLDRDTKVLLNNGAVVRLPPKAVETLLVLLETAGQPVDKEALIHAVWPDTFVEDNNLAHHISVLRKTLGNGEGGTAYIETIPKRGYRFVGEVKEGAEDGVDVAQAAPFEPSRTLASTWPARRAMAATIAALLTAAALVIAWRLNRGSSAPLYQSLAVLPFQNLLGRSQPGLRRRRPDRISHQ